MRRYIPEKEKAAWGDINFKKYKHNPLLANCDTQDMHYASLKCNGGQPKDGSWSATVEECAAVSVEAAEFASKATNCAFSAVKTLVHLINDRREADEEAKREVTDRLKESLGLCQLAMFYSRKTVSLLSGVPKYEAPSSSPALQPAVGEGAFSHWELGMPTQPDIHNDANDEGDDQI